MISRRGAGAQSSRRDGTFSLPCALAPLRETTSGYGPGTTTLYYSVPLVLGTPVIRGSVSTAIRKARAADLKMASATW